MFKITGTSAITGESLVWNTDDLFGFLADCGWEWSNISSIDFEGRI